ncbi:MAG: hypothetical protein H7Y42_04895 [Chitinophagaceae bacterium]|nr:hypothetical protein [Chitinophagaceae bacterium]
MNKIPTREKNPSGLHQRYYIQKVGDFGHPIPIDTGSEYFVLRLDEGGKDPIHINACRIAVNAYANAIEHHLPDLAKDLRERYPVEGTKQEGGKP